MLSPDYLLHCTDDIVALYQAYEDSLLQDMARRIAKMGVSDASVCQMEMYTEAGGVFSDAMKQLATLTGKSDAELKRAFKDAGTKTLAYDNRVYERAGLSPIPLRQSPALLQTLTTGLQKSRTTLQNLTATTAVTSQQAFLQASTLAYMQVVNGGMSYQQAIVGAVRSLADDGTHVLYPSGHRDRVDVAVRRNVLTGVNQTCGQIQLANMEAVGSDLVETTAHIGARRGNGIHNHAGWQGQIFSLTGNRYLHFVETTGFGDGAGLCGWNCRHSFFPFIEGVSTPGYSAETIAEMNHASVRYNGEDIPWYEATQMQREMERELRKQKRELLAYQAAENAAYGDEAAAKALREQYTKDAAKLAKQRAALKDFEEQTGLRRQSDRSQVVGFGRSESQKAVWTVKKVAAQNEISYNDAAKAFRENISVGKQTLQVIPQKQQAHLLETAEPGRSYIIGRMEDAQRLVDRHAGTGVFDKDGNGRFSAKEVVKTDMPIGMVVYPNGDAVSTSSFKIHYRKTGTHVVPRKEE